MGIPEHKSKIYNSFMSDILTNHEIFMQLYNNKPQQQKMYNNRVTHEK